VLDFLGLEPNTPSYLALFSEDNTETIKNSAERILKTSQMIIHYIIEKTGWGLIPNFSDEEEERRSFSVLED